MKSGGLLHDRRQAENICAPAELSAQLQGVRVDLDVRGDPRAAQGRPLGESGRRNPEVRREAGKGCWPAESPRSKPNWSTLRMVSLSPALKAARRKRVLTLRSFATVLHDAIWRG